MTLDLEYTIDTRSPEERAPCRCAECEAAGECARRNVALVAALRKENEELMEAVAAAFLSTECGAFRAVGAGPRVRRVYAITNPSLGGMGCGLQGPEYMPAADAILDWYRKERAR